MVSSLNLSKAIFVQYLALPEQFEVMHSVLGGHLYCTVTNAHSSPKLIRTG